MAILLRAKKMAQPTKKALTDSLVKLLAKKQLDKITIVDLVEDCDVNRRPFIITFATSML